MVCVWVCVIVFVCVRASEGARQRRSEVLVFMHSCMRADCVCVCLHANLIMYVFVSSPSVSTITL